MTAIEHEILECLTDLDRAVQSMAAGGAKANLLPLFEKLDTLAGRLAPEGEGTLRHFLQRKSYEKARLYLEGRGAENQRGSCGGA